MHCFYIDFLSRCIFHVGLVMLDSFFKKTIVVFPLISSLIAIRFMNVEELLDSSFCSCSSGLERWAVLGGGGRGARVFLV